MMKKRHQFLKYKTMRNWWVMRPHRSMTIWQSTWWTYIWIIYVSRCSYITARQTDVIRHMLHKLIRVEQSANGLIYLLSVIWLVNLQNLWKAKLLQILLKHRIDNKHGKILEEGDGRYMSIALRFIFGQSVLCWASPSSCCSLTCKAH